MFNQSLPFAFITIGDFLPFVILAGIFFWLFGIVVIIRYLRSREDDARAAMEPLCVWHYNPSEWQEASAVYDLAKFPKGAAKIQLTLLDVWMIDEERVRRIILDDMRKCVTACRLDNQTLKIRVRSWAIPTRFGNVVYSVQDVRLPIPPGHRDEAIELVRVFNENIVQMNKKVVSVMPSSLSSGLISEINF